MPGRQQRDANEQKLESEHTRLAGAWLKQHFAPAGGMPDLAIRERAVASINDAFAAAGLVPVYSMRKLHDALSNRIYRHKCATSNRVPDSWTAGSRSKRRDKKASNVRTISGCAGIKRSAPALKGLRRRQCPADASTSATLSPAPVGCGGRASTASRVAQRKDGLRFYSRCRDKPVARSAGSGLCAGAPRARTPPASASPPRAAAAASPIFSFAEPPVLGDMKWLPALAPLDITCSWSSEPMCLELVDVDAPHTETTGRTDAALPVEELMLGLPDSPRSPAAVGIGVQNTSVREQVAGGSSIPEFDPCVRSRAFDELTRSWADDLAPCA
jgi:hypothetical protein